MFLYLHTFDVRGETTIDRHCSFEWSEREGSRVVVLETRHCVNCLAAFAHLAARQGLSLTFVEANRPPRAADPIGGFAVGELDKTDVDPPNVHEASQVPASSAATDGSASKAPSEIRRGLRVA